MLGLYRYTGMNGIPLEILVYLKTLFIRSNKVTFCKIRAGQEFEKNPIIGAVTFQGTISANQGWIMVHCLLVYSETIDIVSPEGYYQLPLFTMKISRAQKIAGHNLS